MKIGILAQILLSFLSPSPLIYDFEAPHKKKTEYVFHPSSLSQIVANSMRQK
jgi:hypothetical protein